MNTQSRINSLPRRALAGVVLALVCLNSALAADAPKRELSPASSGPHVHAGATSLEASMQAQLERLALEAAMVDSSAFGQLRMLRDVEAKVVKAPRRAGASEHCR